MSCWIALMPSGHYIHNSTERAVAALFCVFVALRSCGVSPLSCVKHDWQQQTSVWLNGHLLRQTGSVKVTAEDISARGGSSWQLQSPQWTLLHTHSVHTESEPEFHKSIRWGTDSCCFNAPQIDVRSVIRLEFGSVTPCRRIRVRSIFVWWGRGTQEAMKLLWKHSF